MSKKVRVHELAKEYGLTGQEFATKLRELGVSEIKGPQSTLDEFQLLQVEGLLAAHNINRAQASSAGATHTGGLTIKKKKKKLGVEGDEAHGAQEEAAPEAAASSGVAPSATASSAAAPGAPAESESPATEVSPAVRPELRSDGREGVRPELRTEPRPESHPAPAAELEATPPSLPHTKPAPSAPAQPSREAHPETTPQPETAQPSETAAKPLSEPQPRVAAKLETPAAPAVAPRTVEPAPAAEAQPARPAAAAKVEPQAAGAATPPTPSATAQAAAAPAPAAPDVKPVRKPAGKVVGFVDLSKIQAPPSKSQAESRRLRSKDDVAPDVLPTLGHDRKRALVRGDHGSRGQMTASQLREKESGRYLRRKGATPAAPPPARGSRLQRTEVGGSPMAGGEVKIEAPITIKKLADGLALRVNQVLVKAMQSLGLNVNQNSTLDNDTAELLAGDFDVKLVVVEEQGAEDVVLKELVKKRTAVEEANLVVRPPTVAFLGHVDHGKTTMLDKIRNSQIAESESGGITQHIGAYQVQTKSGHTLTIIDTPGHEAFSAMRARGAKAVDIVVLVVAADDGVMPSTVEALNHARAAKVPVVVAVNKCDKPQANPERVRRQLTEQGLQPEEWGGTTAFLEVSALTGKGLDELLERVFLESMVLELKSHDKGPASGIVLEAEIQEGKGRVAFLLVKDGTLNQGDVIMAGEGYGKVRSIHDDRGRSIKAAGPSMPVEVSGLSELPSVGDQFHVVESLEQARDVAEERAKKNRAMSLLERRSVTAENLLQAVAEQKKKTINVVLRCDVQGSLEALKSQLEALVHAEVDVRLLQSGLGSVTEADVNLAAPAGGVVLAFRVGVNDKARVAAERNNVEIRHYDIIYELLDEVRQMMEGTLAPEMTEQITGHIEVRAIFKSSKIGKIAGSHVIDGTVARDAKIRVIRDGDVVSTTAISSLKREKDDAREVREGFDCGVTLKDFEDFEIGDVLEAFKVVAVKRLLKI
ncbi:MAG: translation initiation factor IF-2 [Planctomycetes bacterium]|nr:translation initiation factor IF-2 [Planctomycetota bacterium]